MGAPAGGTFRIGLIVFAVAAASSLGAGFAQLAAWEEGEAYLLGLAAHAWGGLLIWFVINRRTPGAGA